MISLTDTSFAEQAAAMAINLGNEARHSRSCVGGRQGKRMKSPENCIVKGIPILEPYWLTALKQVPNSSCAYFMTDCFVVLGRETLPILLSRRCAVVLFSHKYHEVIAFSSCHPSFSDGPGNANAKVEAGRVGHNTVASTGPKHPTPFPNLHRSP